MLYSPAIRFDFVYEDLRGMDSGLELSQVPETLVMLPTRALTTLSKAADLALFGIQPWGFHLSSVLWHALNVGLVFLTIWAVMPGWGALAAAGVFAWHPLQVESVAYVASRSELVSGAAVLLALWAASTGRVALAGLGVALAGLGKETALVAWALVPLWAFWAAPAFPVWRWVAFAVGAATAAGLFVAWYIHHWAFVFSADLAGAQLVAIWRLVSLVFLPVGLTVDHDFETWAFLGRVALLASVAVTCWALTAGWRRSWWAFAWLWTLVCLSPRLVVPLYEGLHEHHFYLALVGWSVAIGAVFHHPTGKVTDHGSNS